MTKKLAKRNAAKARKIAAELTLLYVYQNDGHKPKHYGNSDLDKAIDAIYKYIESLEDFENWDVK